MSNELLGITISNSDYHADTSRISKSGLDLINKSPLHYHYSYLDKTKAEQKEKEWAKTGSAVGMAVTEIDKFKEEYVLLDDSEICKEIGGKRPDTTNKYKEWYAERLKELEGKTILSPSEHAEFMAMRESVWRHPAAKFLLKEGQAERTFYFTDPETGVKCRIRPDWMTILNGWLVDIKTTADASPDAFAKSVTKFRYHVQDPFYTDGLKENGIDFKGFAFIAVEKEAPHPTAVYFLPAEAKAQGRKEIRANLATYANCLSSGKWPGYNELLTELTLPPWAFK